MSANSARVRATPFHARAAEANEANDWGVRGGFTLCRAYADANGEALAARLRAGMSDISWRWRLMVEGARAGEFLSRLVTRDVVALAPGQSLSALWLSDGGGVRGAGVIARFGKESFLVISVAPDGDWIAAAAARFDVAVREVTQDLGGLALVGPYAAAVLARAGLDVTLAPAAFKKQFWRGLDVTVSRWGAWGGFELWCAADDALILWDRLMRAGAPFGLEPIGLAACDVLDLEAGIVRPGRDYAPASAGDAAMPTPRALGLESLVDDAHTGFNGRIAFRAARDGERLRLVGIEIDAETPAAHTPLLRGDRPVGRTLASVYSPALRRAIALAQIEADAAATGTELTLTLSPNAEAPQFRPVAARVADLPLLPMPDPVAP